MKIYINPIPGTLHNEIFLIDKDHEIGYFLTCGKDGEVISNQFKRSDCNVEKLIKPFIILQEDLTRDLISAFCILGKARGIEADSESKAKGKLEATERHLEDMRTIVFKTKK